MAFPTITLFNLTISDIDLTQLTVTVPGSGDVVASDFNFTEEILNDVELQTELDAGNIRIDISGGGLSSSDTVKTLEQSKAIIKPLHDLDIKHNLAGAVAPVATDDENAGYSVGSIWVDETGGTAYICVDATAAAAVWNPMGGAAGTWAATLAAGEVSGGTDAVMSVGDTFRGVDSTTTTGGALAVRGGATTFAGLVNGGDVTVDGGDYGGSSIFARGGNVTIAGGVPATNGSGGAVNIFGATPLGGTGTGGAVFITSGEGATGGGNANGGNLSILTGDGKVSGQGGSITIACGDSPSFGAGASMTLTAGLCTGGSGTGGDLNLNAGAGSEVGGDVFITAGAKTVGFGAPNNSGNVVIKSGAASGVNGVLIGSITLQTPDVNDVGQLNTSGNINLITGNGGLSNADAGHLNITLGNAQSGANNQGGSMFITCGDDVAGTSSSTGGEFSVICGDTNIGTAGRFIVACGSSIGASGSGGSVIVTAGQGGATSGANGNVTFVTQSSAGTGVPGYFSIQNDATSTTAARQGEFRVETDKGQFGLNYIGTRTMGAETTDVTLTRIMTLVTVATNFRVYNITVTVSGIATASADTITRTYQAAYYRAAAGAVLIAQTTVNQGDTGTGNTWAAQLTTSGNDVFIQVQGENGKDVRWVVQATVQEGGMAA